MSTRNRITKGGLIRAFYSVCCCYFCSLLQYASCCDTNTSAITSLVFVGKETEEEFALKLKVNVLTREHSHLSDLLLAEQ